MITAVDEEAKKQGWPAHEHMTQRDANTCYFRGERAILEKVPSKTPTGRTRSNIWLKILGAVMRAKFY